MHKHFSVMALIPFTSVDAAVCSRRLRSSLQALLESPDDIPFRLPKTGLDRGAPVVFRVALRYNAPARKVAQGNAGKTI
jgi:hypothetical protein